MSFDLPKICTIDGREYAFNTDFRAGIWLELQSTSDALDVGEMLGTFFPEDIPADVDSAVEAILWFYRCDYGQESKKQKERRKKVQQAYDFEQDADALYTSFRHAYGIDLYDDDLHWWKFRRLMFGLPDDSPFMMRIRYRTADISGLKGKVRQAWIAQRNRVALKSRKTQHHETLEERNAAMRQYIALRQEEVKQFEAQNEG